MVRLGLVAVVAAGVLGGCSPPPVCACAPPPLPFKLAFTTTISGRTAALSPVGRPPSFDVRPGQSLEIEVVVTVPKRARVSVLWLGITAGTLGQTKAHRPTFDPILAHTRRVLTAGLHSFRLRWRVPRNARPGRAVYLAADWASRQPPTFDVGQFVARLVPHRRS